MKTIAKSNGILGENIIFERRDFLKKGAIIGILTGVTGLSTVAGCKEEAEDISPSEDLMREHGVLNRILLIYDECRRRILNNEQFPIVVIQDSAQIIRNFIEDYHEKLEEDFLFPRFEKAGQLTDLVKVLREQHQAGRRLTDQIISSVKAQSLADESESRKMAKLLNDFNTMYRPHEAREDTVLFPAIRKIISDNEYFALGEDFEDKEHELFGEDGFESMVEKVASIEKKLDIYELSKFTPAID